MRSGRGHGRPLPLLQPGGGPTGPGKALGWFVGYVETRGNVYFFAINTDGPSYSAIKDKRIDLTKAALQAVGVLPETPTR